jgi:chemotaxis family two-component system sensor kinase Cph1
MTSENGSKNIDLKACDREPIRVPGAIQPHGALLVIGAGDGIVRSASRNAAAVLGVEDVLGLPLEACSPALAAVVAAPGEQSSPLLRGQWSKEPGVLFDVFVRAGASAGSMVVELERSHHAPLTEGADLRADVTTVMATLSTAADVDDLLARSCRLVADFSGFDRVMAYRFEPDEHGVVVAEVRQEELEPFLGLHYPASDIPRQARELYREQWLRIIPDARYEPVPIEADPGHADPAPLDLSECVLRAVSPVHLQYLANMGVRASMSVSLIVDGRLWGLVACHHYSAPRHLDYRERAACEFVGLAAASQIGIRESLEAARQKEARSAAEAVLIEKMAALNSVPDGLTTEPKALLSLCDAAGAIVSFGGQVIHVGVTPAVPGLRDLAAELTEQAMTGVLVSDRWAAEHPDHPGDPATMSGVVAMSLARGSGNYLAWFRPELSATVTWAGRPDKVVIPGDAAGVLSPRSSFAAWEEEVGGRSAPWTAVDTDAVLGLQSSIGTFLIGHTERLERLNQDLARSNEELDAFAYAAAHDLKEPLRGISNYAQFLAEDYEDVLDEEGRNKLSTLVRLSRRMATLLDSLLDYSRVGRAPLRQEALSLGSVVGEVTEMLGTAIDEARATVSCTADGTVRADRAALREVLLNLVSNALKYNDGEAVIEVRLEPRRDSDGSHPEATLPCVSVSDNGIGISDEHLSEIFRVFRRLHGREAYGGGTGVGLTIARRIVERLGGSIWVESEVGRGSTFFFTLGGGQ